MPSRLLLGAVAAATAFTVAPASAQDWTFSLTPYFWMAGEKGQVAPFPVLPAADVDLSFGDVLNELQFALAAAAEARNDRWGILVDAGYMDVGLSKHTSFEAPNYVAVGVGTKAVTATGVVAYRVVEGDGANVDLFGGARVSWVKNEVRVRGPAGNEIGGDNGETWVDPVIGARVIAPLGEKWSVTGYGDIGGFGISSDLTWQLYGAVNYQLTDRYSLAGGYRYYSVDYDKGGFLNDVEQYGPMIAFKTQF